MGSSKSNADETPQAPETPQEPQTASVSTYEVQVTVAGVTETWYVRDNGEGSEAEGA